MDEDSRHCLPACWLVFDVDDAAVDEDFVVVAVAAELIVY